MRFTDKQIQGAAILMGAHAMEALPESFSDYLSAAQSDDLMREVMKAVREALEFYVQHDLEVA